MPGSFVGGSGSRDVSVGKREVRKKTKMSQGAWNIAFSSSSGERAFEESNLLESDLGEPSGKGGKYTVQDIKDAEARL